MDTFLAIASKRDWRKFSDRAIPEEVRTRILDAGRLTGNASNKQVWRFIVADGEGTKQRLSETVYAAGNVLNATFVVVIAAPAGELNAFDAGRAAQNMFLAAWNEGVASVPNGMPDPAATGEVVALEGDLKPHMVLSFGYPKREVGPESRSPEEWSAEANRKPLDEFVDRR